MKLSQRRKTALALAVAATILGGSNAYAAVEHDKAISESNQYGDSMRTYWQTQGIYDATKHSYTFSDDVSLKPKASEQDLNYWTPMFGGIYIAGDNSATIDMQGHRLDVAMNVDQVKVGSVNNVNAINANGIHVTSSGLTINNLKGMDISVGGAFLSTGNVHGIYVSGTNQEGAYNDGEGRASLTINNADGWDNAVKFHSSQSQVENAIEVKKNTGSADLSISGMVDLYVGNDADVITVSGGTSYYGIDSTPTAYIGGGAIKASMGRAANISGGSLFINSTLDNGKIAAADGSRDVQVEGNILVKDLQSDQGTLTLAMNTAKSYFNGVINSQNGKSDAGDAYILLQNGAQWTNASKGDYSYSGSALKQFAGGSSAAGTGYIFQNDSSALNLGDYSGYTTIFYSHSDDGTQTSQYSAGNTIVDTAKAGSNITLVTDNVDSDNDTTVAAALNALAGKLYYNGIKNGENALDGTAVIADGLTASSKSLKTAAIYFNEESGQGTTTSTSKQGKTDFTTTLTGVTADDSEYAEANVIADDGSYKFDKATTIAVKGNTINAKGDITIKADKTLTLNVKDVTKDSGHGINMATANTVAIKAGLLKMDLTGTNVTSDGLQGVRITNGDAKLTLDGDLDITVNGDNNTIGIYNRGNVVVNGDVALDVDGNNGGFQYYGATGIYATSSMGSTKGGNVTVNGNVDFQGNANGLWSNAGGGVVTVKGGSIVVKEGQTMGYAAIKAENGVVNMNVVRDADGNVTGADSNDVIINGNLSLDTGAVNANDTYGTKSEINLGLTTQKSSLTGVVQNSFGDAGKTAGGLTFTGAANLWLQNGATWNNEVVDKIITAPWGGEKWTGSHVAKLVGGASEATAGNIFQNDTNSLTIDSYSGNTNIYYAHEGNGEAAENYTAGDTIIKSAAADSVVSMITDNTNVATDNNDSVANVLNALAGKLTYSNFASGEANLTGYVKIADGLTASSKAMKTGDITFNDEGKGTYVKKEIVEKSAFTTALTGNKSKDTEYEGNINSDGSYFFTKDSTITLAGVAENGGAINAEADLTVNADSALGLTVSGKNTNSYGLTKTNGKQVVINAKNLNIDVTNSYGRADAIHVNGSASGARGSLTVNGDVFMKSTHDASGGYAGDYTLGTYAMQSDITINGNVTSVIDAGSGANAYYGATHLYATGATGSQTDGYKAATITVNGDVDLSGTAQGIFANIGGAVVTVNGGGKILVDEKAAKSNGYAAIRAEDSLVNMNVKLDETGKKATAGLGNDVVIKGNVTASVGAVNSIDTNGTMTRINLALDTAKSSLDGALVNGFDRTDGTTGIDTEADEGGTVSKHFDGELNLWLQNGAQWNNKLYGSLKFFSDDKYKTKFQGSHVTDFVGGSDAAHTGYIAQNTSEKLTIDNYSGYATLFYSHTANTDLEDLDEDDEQYTEDASTLDGSQTWHYLGDTIIKKAAADSHIALVTDNANINTADSEQVNKVLNALAGKLYYNAYVNNERNLAGTVSIADGLTASSFSKTYQSGDITFSETTGQGSYSVPVGPEPKTEFTTPITGDTAADTEYAGNIQDGKYVFAADTTVKVAGASVVDVKTPFTAEAGSNKLSLVATKGDWSSVSTAFSQNVAGTTKITAGELVIGASSDTDLYDRSAMVVQNGAGVDITAVNTTIYAHNDLGSVAYGIYAKDKKSRVDIHGDLKLEVEGMGLAHGLLAEDTSYMGGNASIINVDGKADISVKKGNAVAVIRSGSTINLGGGTVQIDKDSSSEHYALKADGGSINVNMNADKTAAGSTKTVIKGNLSAYGAKTYAMFDMDDTDSTINLGLSGSESSLTGAAFCMDTGSSSWPFKGFINMYLDNGATWNNEQWGKINSSFTGSHVTKLVGGTSEATAGNIFQNDSKNLTIDSYSGNTNIYYAHTGSGEAAGNYAAGDTIIKSAAAGSVVSLITDNTNVATDNESSVANVLNSLAGKLTYSNYVSGENNLTGYVKIADGLTASSNTLKVDNIKYNATTGQGYTKTDVVIPDDQTDDSFTEVITGEQQETYVNSGVQKDDKSYVFTKDTTVSINQMTKKEADPDWEGSYLVSGAAVQNSDNVKEVVINAADKTLKLNVALDDDTVPPTANAGILNNRIPLRGVDNSVAGSTTSITADTLDINVDNTYSRKTSSGNPLIGAGSSAGIYANSTDDKAVVDVAGNTAIKAHGYNNVYGITVSGNAEVKLHGDLTMAKVGDVWAIDNVINGSNTTTLGEASWRNIAGISASGAGANVTVDGKTAIAAHGSGVVALDGATVNLGDADIELKNNSDEQGYAFHAIGAALGTVNVGGEGKTVSVKGNVGLFGKQGQQFSSDSKTSVVNLQLTNDASTWTGVAYKYFTDDEKTAGYDGSLNLTLANGAAWNNEKYGHTYGDADWEKYKFTGSRVAKFVGGESAAKAGNIFQNDSNSLTIDSYSGNTNIYYVHTGNGEEAADYAAGNTIIKSAAAGSGVSMITDNSGVDMDNEASVKNVFNSLAGKLIYSNYTVGERNLAGYVKIADGLTASSKALQAGDISFNETTGQGSYKTGSLTPGYTYPDSQQTDKFTQPITGDEKQDNVYKQQGVLKDDGEYVFTQNPTEITVDSGAAVDASEHNVNIDTSKAKLELNGKDQGILADGHDVDVKGSTEISGTTGIEATNGGNVTLEGLTNITGTDSAITAGSDSSVNISGGAATIKGGLNADGGNITIDGGKTTTEIEGNVNANNGGSIELMLNEKSSTLTGGYSAGENSSIVLNLQSGATWNLQDGPTDASDAGSLTVNGGAAQGDGGYIIMNRTKDLNIDNYSGWETVIYSHENAGSDAADYKAGDTVIAQAAAGSGVVLSTDNSGITMTDKSAVENTLKALARKVVYSDHEANSSNLTGKVQIADGLTAASVSKYLGSVSWDADGRGQYDLDSINWQEIVEGDYETLVMKGVRSAATTSLHSWRDNMQDTYTGADLADEDGIFVKALGGKTSSEVKGVKDSNTYYGVQVGYDKAVGNGWHTGVAFDYRDGDSDYLLGGKGDNQLYSLGVYGVKSFADQSYLRVAVKAGRVENEYDVYNEIRSLKLHGDYKANAYGLTMEYGKTFGQEDTYITPKVQLTWSQVGSKDYSAHTANDSMRIAQDSYSSFVGRLGFEAGVKSAKGRLYAGLYAAHEFNGEITASYYAKDGGMKHTSFDGEDTWMEMSIGGAYALSNNCHFYADFAKDFGGDFQRKWKANAGLRFEF